MKTRRLKSILLLSGILLVTGCNVSQTVTLQPGPQTGKDSFFWTEPHNAGKNYGSAHDLQVGEFNPGSNYMMYTLIEFTELSKYMGVALKKATLELYCNNTNISSANIYLCKAGEEWDEYTVCCTNKPSMDEASVNILPWTVFEEWWSVDVTDIVRDWLNGSSPNNGFYIYCDSDETGDQDEWTSWYSSDYPGATERPKLILEYY